MRRLNNFTIRYLLLIIILFLLAAIIINKKQGIKIPFESKDILATKNEEEFLIYVVNNYKYLFPLNVIAKYDDDYQLNYYADKINNDTDRQIYTTFSLLTNLSNYLPNGVTTLLPKSTRLINYDLKDEVLTLNLSKEFLNYNKNYESEIFKIITYTFTELPEVTEIKLLCENHEVSNLKKLKRENFVLNMYINNSGNASYQKYQLYYCTEINQNEFLVPVTILDNNQDLSKKEKVIDLLTQTFDIPLRTHIENEITTFAENIASFQYYLSCFDNNIIETDREINIKMINFYYIEFR